MLWKLEHLAEEPVGGLRIPFGAEHKVDRLAGGIHSTVEDDGHDSHNIRHGFFKWLHQIELATNASINEKVGSIYFATLFEIMAIWRFLYKLPTYQRITNPVRQPRVIFASKPLEFWRILCESYPSSNLLSGHFL
jgi:hypothetical protein